MMNNIDPYDMLIELNERLLRLERAHNGLVRQNERLERELTIALDAVKTNQQHLLKLHQIIKGFVNKE